MPRQTFKRYKNIFLVGLPGVGKSTFGHGFAIHSFRAFYDLDRLIEKEQGRSITQIFEKDGEEEFREIERHCFQRVTKKQNVVLALGGGAITSEKTLQWARQQGLLVFLTDRLESIAARVFAEKEKRPHFKAAESVEDVLETLKQLEEERAPTYAASDLTLNLAHSSFDAAKIELSAFESCAFRESYQKDLEAMGESLPLAPGLVVQHQPRYVLQEKPYLASVGVQGSGLKSRKKTGQRPKKLPRALAAGAKAGSSGGKGGRKARGDEAATREVPQSSPAGAGPEAQKGAGSAQRGSAPAAAADGATAARKRSSSRSRRRSQRSRGGGAAGRDASKPAPAPKRTEA